MFVFCFSQSTVSLSCLSFCGPSLKVASVVIKEDVNTEEEVNKLILRLKNCQLSEEQSFGFMFACVGRGKNFFLKDNLESSLFRKHFPNTPLFGFFGNGEVGFEYLHKNKPHSNASKQCASESTTKSGDHSRLLPIPTKPLPKLYHAYTTIMCLISVV